MLIDAFTYNGEQELLKVRLALLAPHVDRFVIVEADKTFRGKPKSKKYNPEYFQEYSNQIAYYFITDLKENPISSWENEILQRNALALGLYGLDDDDIIMLSDVDEIPNPESIRLFDRKQIYAALVQTNHCYRINWMVHDRSGHPVFIDASKIITYGCFKRYFRNFTALRWEKHTGPFRSFKRFYLKNKRQTIQNGGWHLSYMMSPEMIGEKLKSFSHAEFDTPHVNNLDNIRQRINNRVLLTSEDETLIEQDIASQFPLNIRAMAEFKKLC